MKKILLSLAVACLWVPVSSNAQVLWTQDFESVTPPALPAGWGVGGSTGSPSWYTGTTEGSTWGSLTGAVNLPSHTKYIVVDDAAHPTQLHDTVMSQTFSVTGGYPNLFMNYDYFFYGATNNSSGKTEYSYMLGSSNGGATWAVIDTLWGYGWGGTWVSGHANLSSLTGTNCKVAYTYTDNGGAILGVAVDNVQLQNMTADSVGLNSITYNSSVNGISINGETLTFSATNYGKPASYVVYYTVNGGTPVTQTFPATGTQAPFTTASYTFTTPIAGLTSGTNTIKVAVGLVNSAANTRSIDTVKTSTCIMASASTQRNALVEEFTSSTCPPCASFAVSFDPLCNSLNANDPSSHFNVIKYQMNWPDWNDDRSYNADGNSRKSYYGVTGIPEHLVNGVVDNMGWSSPFTTAQTTAFTAEFAAAAANKAFVDITVTYAVDTISKKLYATTKVTPHFTNSNTYHLYVAAADKHYQNIGNEWGMLDYYHAMRKMFPNGSGHSLAAFADGVAQTFYDTAIAYTNGNWVPASLKPADSAGLYPRQMSNTFWANPLLSSEVVAYVQEDATKSIMNSVAAPATDGSQAWEHHLSVSTLSEVKGISIFPNPAKDEATLRFNLGETGNVTVSIMELSGRVVSNVISSAMTAGNQTVVIPTANIIPGNYIVVITTDKGTNAERLTIEK